MVDKLREESKFFDCSREEIERELVAEGYYEVYSDCEVDNEGSPCTAKLRLNITRATDNPQRCSVALKLHDVRIDGIDYEGGFTTLDGTRSRGWHRHVFHQGEQNAERGKIALDDFGKGLDSLTTFLIRAFSEMKIAVNKNDSGYGQLPLD